GGGMHTGDSHHGSAWHAGFHAAQVPAEEPVCGGPAAEDVAGQAAHQPLPGLSAHGRSWSVRNQVGEAAVFGDHVGQPEHGGAARFRPAPYRARGGDLWCILRTIQGSSPSRIAYGGGQGRRRADPGGWRTGRGGGLPAWWPWSAAPVRGGHWVSPPCAAGGARVRAAISPPAGVSAG